MTETIKIILIITLLVVYIGIRIFIRHLLSKKAKTEKRPVYHSNIIKQPKLYLHTGIFGISIFTGGAIFAYLTESEPYYIVMIIAAFLYVPSIPFQVNWKIEVNESEFTYRNMWGRKRTFTYDEIEVRLLSRCTRYYKNGKHIVGISFLQDNWDCLQKAISTYKKNQKKKKQDIVKQQ